MSRQLARLRWPASLGVRVWFPALLLLAWPAAQATNQLPLRDISGAEQRPLAPIGRGSILFFVMVDCPISNAYAPEIRRICQEFATAGFQCYLVYTTPDRPSHEIRNHFHEYRHGDYPALQDAKHALSRAVGATITPETAVVGPQGEVLYLGRIDDSYISLGKPRRQPTRHDLRDALQQIAQGRSVETARTQAVGCYIPDY